MNFSTSNYGAARGILGFSEITLWCGVGFGVIVAIVAGGAASRGFGSSGLLAAVPGISISIFCFVGVVLVQMAKATVDTADYSYQMLGVARDQLAVSKQALAKAETPQSFADRAPTTASETAPERTALGYGSNGMQHLAHPSDPALAKRDWDYRGLRINRTVHGYLVEGQTFETLDLAKEHIDMGTRS